MFAIKSTWNDHFYSNLILKWVIYWGNIKKSFYKAIRFTKGLKKYCFFLLDVRWGFAKWKWDCSHSLGLLLSGLGCLMSLKYQSFSIFLILRYCGRFSSRMLGLGKESQTFGNPKLASKPSNKQWQDLEVILGKLKFQWRE